MRTCCQETKKEEKKKNKEENVFPFPRNLARSLHLWIQARAQKDSRNQAMSIHQSVNLF